MRNLKIFFILNLLLCAVASAQTRTQSQAANAQTSPPFEFKDGDRVVFLGDTFIEREQSYGHIETRLTSRCQNRNVVFRNLGWSGDSVLGESRAGFDAPEKGFDKLKAHLAAVKPTVVFLGYGMASSFDGTNGLPKFRADMDKLIDTIKEISKGEDLRFVIMSPIRHENLGKPLPDPAAHNEVLAQYAAVLKEIAAQRQARFIPLFDLTTQMEAARMPKLTDNGIHPHAFGYWRVAEAIERSLGLRPKAWRLGIGANGDIRSGSAGTKVSDMKKTDSGMTFTGEDEFLIAPPISPSINRGNIQVPNGTLQVVGLKPGEYTLKVDGRATSIHTDQEWSKGQAVTKGPLFDQVEELREAIVKKNELYFYRWRPQNETYLFGFRKYEQGQNAREIPMFDPLVSAAEQKIADLKKPKTHKYELVAFTKADRDELTKAGQKKLKPEKPAPTFTAAALPTPDFDLGPGLEVSLYAENPSLAKPIQMNFDTQGRLWVASSSVYPQIQPGQEANDKILILEDTDGDGKVDKTTVFADGLLIPTGVEPGDGGAYVGNSTELVHFKDLDGDGKADSKKVILSGFGTEDTHHILHTLRWGFDGQLYMNQSIYIHSHLETPHGVVRLNSGGILNLRPTTMELGVHMKGLVNSWGHHFDHFGQSFATDGAGGEGINWVVPQAMYVTYAGARRILGSVSPGNYPKFASLEVIESEHFPPDWQGTMVTCDFRAHRVVRFSIGEQDSGYITKEMPDIMRTTDVTFRPIDVKLGPDGALYIADWSNPIIQHGEVDFRDPRRDHEHGRIWRVTAKGRALLPKPQLVTASNTALLDVLASPNGYERQRARRVLTERGEKILPDLEKWTANQTTEQGQLEALWMWQSVNVVNEPLLEKVLAAKDGRIRTAAARVLSFWAGRVAAPQDKLAKLSQDDFPRARMEAARALAKIPNARSAELVLSILDKPMDKFLDYAVWLSINDLAQPWIEAIKSGAWKTEGRERQLEFGLKAIQPQQASAVLAQVVQSKGLPKDGSGPWIELIGKAGGPNELGLLFEQVAKGNLDDAASGRALAALSEAARLRNARPPGDLAPLGGLLGKAKAQVEVVRLIGAWKLGAFAPKLVALAADKSTEPTLRQSSFQSLREVGGSDAVQGLEKLGTKATDLPGRQQAVLALAALDLNKAVPLSIEALTDITDENEALAFWRSLLNNKGAAAILAHQLPKNGLPAVMAKTGLRAAREGGRKEPNLVLALARNVDAEDEAKNLTPAELQQLIGNIAKNGDPARGEKLYRRAELACVTCHSIGGVGGKVGPDMTSIGASAQVDYLIESVQFPNKKIKEGYHSVMVETKDGQEFSGIPVRENNEQLVLRDVTNKEVAVPKNNIQKRTTSGSLMPSGLIDSLPANDQADLYRFLSELGKPGPYDASKGNVARLWRLLPATLEVAQFGDEKVLRQPLTSNGWAPAFSLVDGRLGKAELEGRLNEVKGRSPSAIYAAAQFEISKAGTTRLQLENLGKAAVWIDGKSVAANAEIAAELAAGPHTIIVKLAATGLPEHIRLRTADGTFLTN